MLQEEHHDCLQAKKLSSAQTGETVPYWSSAVWSGGGSGTDFINCLCCSKPNYVLSSILQFIKHDLEMRLFGKSKRENIIMWNCILVILG